MSRRNQMEISTHCITYARPVLQPHGAITALQLSSSWSALTCLLSFIIRLIIIILRGQCPHAFKSLGASAPAAPMLRIRLCIYSCQLNARSVVIIKCKLYSHPVVTGTYLWLQLSAVSLVKCKPYPPQYPHSPAVV